MFGIFGNGSETGRGCSRHNPPSATRTRSFSISWELVLAISHTASVSSPGNKETS